MIIKLILLLPLLIPSFIYTQEKDSIYYSLLYKDCCSEKIKTIGTIYTDWYVTNEEDFIFRPQKNRVLLIQGQNYFLNNEWSGIVKRPISLQSSINIDTLNSSCLKSKSIDGYFSWNPIHMNCEDTLNGKYIEYHDNGNISSRGNFINGKIKDTLVHFYANNKTKSVTLVDNSHIIYKTYHLNGQVSHIYDSQKKNKISYFENGNVRSKSSNSKLKYYKKYTNKQLWFKIKKSKQISYYRSGNIEQKLTRKTLSFIDKFKSNNKKKTFRYKFNNYDSLGVLIKKTEFYSDKQLRLYSLDLYRLVDNFSYCSYYQNGEIVVTFISEMYRGEHGESPIKYTMYKYKNGKIECIRDLLPYEFKEVKLQYEK